MGESSSYSLVQKILETVNAITSIGEFKTHKKNCATLTRRLKLLVPLLEEVRELRLPLSEEAGTCFRALDVALYSAKDLVVLCSKGSKLYLILKRQYVGDQFRATNTLLEHALDELPREDLEISDEVREQVELVHTQFRRAKGGDDPIDVQLYAELLSVLEETDERLVDRDRLERLADLFKFDTARALKRELQALQGMKLEKEPLVNGILDDEKEFLQICGLLDKLKALFSAEDLEDDNPEVSKMQDAQRAGLEKSSIQPAFESEQGGTPNIPDDFKCPISLELMAEPVIVATGQTYELACIKKWLDGGNRTCPKTGSVLQHTGLTPNHALHSVIAEWCEKHGVEAPKKVASRSNCSLQDKANISDLIAKLSSSSCEVQRDAACELRLLAKRNVEHRICIAEQDAIPRLVSLLVSYDRRTQEHAVTALLNLSINDNNKGLIMAAGAIKPIVEVLWKGSTEARENAAATLFSLSVVDDNKVTIGNLGAIPALVELLRVGTPRGKKDAATALFNLSIYQGNKSRAVKAKIVPPLMALLADPSSGMLDEALAILAVLATHQEGRSAIGVLKPAPILVDTIRIGSDRNKENAVAMLLALCSHDPTHLIAVKKLDAAGPLNELAQDGTARAKRKATNLMELLTKQDLNNAIDETEALHL